MVSVRVTEGDVVRVSSWAVEKSKAGIQRLIYIVLIHDEQMPIRSLSVKPTSVKSKRPC